MRVLTLIVGVAVGVGAYKWYTQQNVETRRRFTMEPRHTIQDDEARESVNHMIDEVVHRDDIPETPIKQAFEHAIESK